MAKPEPRISAAQTVREVIERYPGCAKVFALYGLDACCGGLHPIELAAHVHNVPLEPLLEALRSAAR